MGDVWGLLYLEASIAYGTMSMSARCKKPAGSLLGRQLCIVVGYKLTRVVVVGGVAVGACGRELAVDDDGV